MDWSTTADIATAVGTVVALVGVVASMVFTLRSERLTRDGQQLERAQAEATAARSEAAAALTEEYTRRVVDALETMATVQSTGGASTSTPGAGPVQRRVTWRMAHHGGDRYIVENTGDKRALNVKLSADESLMFEPDDSRDLEPGEAMTFLAVLTFGTRDSTVTVEWTDEDTGLIKSWRYPLPGRPPR